MKSWQMVFKAVALVVFSYPVSGSAQKPPAPAQAPPPVQAAPPAVASYGGLLKCVDAEGKVEYRNVGESRGCTVMKTDPVNTAPFPRPQAKPASASRTESAAQRSRDGDRRKILEDELASEEKRLAELRKEFNNGEPERRGDERNYQRYLDRTERLKADIARGEANVESLRRELGASRN